MENIKVVNGNEFERGLTVQISTVVLVVSIDGDCAASPRVGEVTGPWDSEAEAVREVLLDGQRYEVRGNRIFAEAISEE